MTMTVHAVLGAIAIVIAVLLTLAYFLDSAYRRGYEKGHKAADDWWIGVECGSDKARQEIWREEEARKGEDCGK